MSAGPTLRPDGERVRFCLRCGEVVPFAIHVCPACGHYEAGDGVGAGPTRDCDACGGAVAGGAIWCPLCGDETGLVPMPTLTVAPRDGGAEGTPTAESAGPAGVLLWTVLLAGPLTVAAALFLTMRSGGA